jgi:hypothetical protein
MKTIPRAKQQWITKHSSGFCSVGKMAKRTGLRPTDECPRCGEVESTEHVWLCKHPEAVQLWENSMEELRVHLRTTQTPNTTINVIIEGLQGWRRGENTQFNTHTDAGNAGAAQSEAGWKHFFEGRPHKIWQVHRQLYLFSGGKGPSSKRWVTSIILVISHRHSVGVSVYLHVPTGRCTGHIRPGKILMSNISDPHNFMCRFVIVVVNMAM